MRIVNKTKSTTVATRAVVALDFFARLCGLIPKKFLLEGEALVIPGCKSIHMFFMRFPIDAVFLDGKNRVIGTVSDLKPFCLSRIYWKANSVIELKAGTIAYSRTTCGDEIELQEG